jgi:hypothetical protein
MKVCAIAEEREKNGRTMDETNRNDKTTNKTCRVYGPGRALRAPMKWAKAGCLSTVEAGTGWL